MPAHHQVEETAPPSGPSENEVLGEIGITLAIHLVVALAIGLVLQAYGIV